MLREAQRGEGYYHHNGPVIDFFNAERGKMLVSLLQQVLGKVSKEEKFIEQRTYTPKIFSQEEFQDKSSC